MPAIVLSKTKEIPHFVAHNTRRACCPEEWGRHVDDAYTVTAPGLRVVHCVSGGELLIELWRVRLFAGLCVQVPSRFLDAVPFCADAMLACCLRPQWE